MKKIDIKNIDFRVKNPLQIRLLESDQKCLRHESSTKPLLASCKGDR